MERINKGQFDKEVSRSAIVGESRDAMIRRNLRRDGIVPDLAGVSVTMLWSLHNRASEAKRPDSILNDPDSIYIQSSIDYDFARQFGEPLGSLAGRAVEIDRVLRSWLDHHPEGIIVSLGEGLETQSRRVDNGRMRWLSVTDASHRPTAIANSPIVPLGAIALAAGLEKSPLA
jgi:hypothetical protein